MEDRRVTFKLQTNLFIAHSRRNFYCCSEVPLTCAEVRIRSTYLAITSASRFTASPGFNCEKLVTSKVLGMIAISKKSSARWAIARLTPSTATEPLKTRYGVNSWG